MIDALLGALLGVASGMRHAIEPDHLAAVSTLVAEQKSARASMLYATLWGFGHALMLLVVGGALFLGRRQMPVALGETFELGVAVMLIGLGVRSLWVARSEGGKPAPMGHDHDHAHEHHHGGTSDHVHFRARTLALRPLAIGVVHGLAGSGALTALVISRVATPTSGLFFMFLYGLGATVGMALLAGIFGIPLARLTQHRRAASILLSTTGLVSLVLGFVWAWRQLAG